MNAKISLCQYVIFSNVHNFDTADIEYLRVRLVLLGAHPSVFCPSSPWETNVITSSLLPWLKKFCENTVSSERKEFAE